MGPGICATKLLRPALCDLVAFHSSAAAEAEVLGLMDEMREFKDERSTVRDLLWYLPT